MTLKRYGRLFNHFCSKYHVIITYWVYKRLVLTKVVRNLLCLEKQIWTHMSSFIGKIIEQNSWQSCFRSITYVTLLPIRAWIMKVNLLLDIDIEFLLTLNSFAWVGQRKDCIFEFNGKPWDTRYITFQHHHD